jgi:hypothetical protein
MKKVKTYREIKHVEMDNDRVYAVYFEKKEGVLYPEEIFRTKDEVLKDAEHVRASGYSSFIFIIIYFILQQEKRLPNSPLYY